MFSCERAKDVWCELGLYETVENALAVERSGSVVLEEILRGNSKTPEHLVNIGLKEAIVVGGWYIWWQRRELVDGEKVAPLDRTAFSIQALAANYSGAQTLAVPKEIAWQRPSLNSYKLNIDACFFPNGSGAAGAIIQNSNGQAVPGASWELNNMLDATTAEAVTFERGLQFFEQIGCSSVIIESDSLQLVQAFNGVVEIWSSPYTAILADCCQRVRRIGQITVQHCFREANSVTHKLARVSFDSKNFIF
jgi:ribonuclease HI